MAMSALVQWTTAARVRNPGQFYLLYCLTQDYGGLCDCQGVQISRFCSLKICAKPAFVLMRSRYFVQNFPSNQSAISLASGQSGWPDFLPWVTVLAICVQWNHGYLYGKAKEVATNWPIIAQLINGPTQLKDCPRTFVTDSTQPLAAWPCYKAKRNNTHIG